MNFNFRKFAEAVLIIGLLCLSLLLQCTIPDNTAREAPVQIEPGRTAGISLVSPEEDPAGQTAPNETKAEPTEEETTVEETPPETIPAIPSITVGEQEIPLDALEADISYTDIKGLGIDMEQVFADLPYLRKITMVGCGLSNYEYAALQDLHPDIKIIWDIVLSHWIIRTDRVAFSTAKSTTDTFFMDDSEAYFLRYCTDMVALDLGHNHISDLSFLQFMPNLKILILADNPNTWDQNLKATYLSDLSWLMYCPKLRYLECFYNFDIRDYTFLYYLPYLEDLNISYTGAYSIEPLKYLPCLQRLWMEHTYISYEDYVTLTTLYPYTKIVYFGEGSVDQGWRDPGTHYEIIKDMFAYDYVAEYYQD